MPVPVVMCFNMKCNFHISVFAAGHHAHGQAEVSVPEQKVAEGAAGSSGEHVHSHEQLHAYIGVSLVLGFVFMLLVDQIGSSHMHNSDGQCA